MFRAPVAVTAATWADCVAWDTADARRTGAVQDEDGRLFDVLWMASRAVRNATGPGEFMFKVHRVSRHALPGDDGDIEATVAYLQVTLGGELDGTPTIIISLPGED